MSDQPNVVLLWTDQQHRATMGAYGNDLIDTPNLDELARTGTTFERAYCTQPVCNPSRAAIMTGRYPHETGCVDNGLALPRSARCLPEHDAFDEYATSYVGKWHLGDEVFAQHGFEEWVGVEDLYRAWFADDRPQDAHSAYDDFLDHHGFERDQHSGFGRETEPDDDWTCFSRELSASLPEEYSKPKFEADEASAFIRRHQDEPFLLSVNFLEPHQPFHSCRDDQYDPDEVPLPPNFEHDGFDDQCEYIKHRRAEVLAGRGDDLDGVCTGFDSEPTEAEWRDLISRYWGLVSLVDTHVGRILRTLSEWGLEDDTIVVFTSDHGDHLGAHQVGGKRTMFEESAGIPLLMRVPGTDTAGTRVGRPVSQIDLVPTLLDAAGGNPTQLPGESLLPWFRGSGSLPARDVFVESQFTDAGNVKPDEADEVYDDEWLRDVVTTYKRAIVTPERLKYVYRPGDRDSLYDLDADPHETRNLVDDPAHEATVADLRERLVAAQERVGDPLSGPEIAS